MTSKENWQQGLGYAWLGEDRPSTLGVIPIIEGTAMWGDVQFTAGDGLEELALATGWTQLLAN